jgi:signal transduction histidine kinase
MGRLLSDLLEVTRLESGELPVIRKAVCAKEIIEASVESQRDVAAHASLQIEAARAEALPDIWADHDRLLQVFDNLIGNAIKFTGPGGRIAVGGVHKGSQVHFWVSDTGEGIAAENLSHLFDRFWQATRTDRRGAGLGLPIVKGIIEAHGGRIWAESTLGEGTTFFFTIPVAPTADARVADPAPHHA